jgi:arabinofuranosyltransferase
MPSPAPTSSAGRSDSAAAPGPGNRLEWLCLAACWVPYALLTYRFYFLCDDAFISFRYAKNWVEGYGLRFNLGTHVPVEGYSNFLWVCLAALGELAHLDPRVLMPVLSFLAGSLLMAALFFALRRQLELPLSAVVPACLFLGCSPSFAVWSTSGMETMPFALLVFLTFRQLFLGRDGPAGLTAGLAALGLALIRVEGIEWALLIGLMAVFFLRGRSRRTTRSLLAFFAILLVGYGVYFACRFAYYRLPLPNTAYVKVAPTPATLARGLDYLVVSYLTFLAPLVALLGWPLAWRARRRSVTAPAALLALAFPAYALVVGGDFMTMGRLLVPAWPFYALLLALLLEYLTASWRVPRPAAVGAGLAVVALGLLPAWNIHLVPESVRARFHFRFNTESYRSEYDQWVFMSHKSTELTDVGRILARISNPGDSVVIDTIGAVGYYSGLLIYDQHGLVSREVVEAARTSDELRSPGHDLSVSPEFFLPHRPTFLNLFFVLRGPLMAETIQEGVDRWRLRVDPNLYAPQIVNPSGITGNPQAPLIVLLRRVPEGVDPEDMWARYRTDLRLWSM